MSHSHKVFGNLTLRVHRLELAPRSIADAPGQRCVVRVSVGGPGAGPSRGHQFTSSGRLLQELDDGEITLPVNDIAADALVTIALLPLEATIDPSHEITTSLPLAELVTADGRAHARIVRFSDKVHLHTTTQWTPSNTKSRGGKLLSLMAALTQGQSC